MVVTSTATTSVSNYEHWRQWSAQRRAARRRQSPDLLSDAVDPKEARHMVLPGARKKRAATPAYETAEMANIVASYCCWSWY